MPRSRERDARDRFPLPRRRGRRPRPRFRQRGRLPLCRSLLLRRSNALPLLGRTDGRERLVPLVVFALLLLLLLQSFEPEVTEVGIVVRARAVFGREGEPPERQFDERDAEGPDVGFDRVRISRDAFRLRARTKGSAWGGRREGGSERTLM